MLLPTQQLLADARKGRYAVGAFNIYNLEGATAVVRTAEQLRSPVMLQVLPSALEIGGKPLVAMCLSLAEDASVPVAVHLDHCSDISILTTALEYGMSSVMADGSDLSLAENIRFTSAAMQLAAEHNGSVEAELGKLSGEEDGIAVADREACMTSPDEAEQFVEQTNVAALAVCIGNVHGKYTTPPRLDFERLEEISQRLSVPLVMHGTSGLPEAMIRRSVALGVCKFNVNTEIRTAFLDAVASRLEGGSKAELVELMQLAIAAMQKPVAEKIRLFCSADKAC